MSPAIATAAPSGTVVPNSTVLDFLARKAQVPNFDAMPTKAVRGIDRTGPPVVGGVVEFFVGGVKHVRPRNLGDLHPEFSYAWLTDHDVRTKSEYSNGWYLVTKSNVFGEGLPVDCTEVDPQTEFVCRGECKLWGARAELPRDQKADGRARVNRVLEHAARSVSAEQGASGSLTASVSAESRVRRKDEIRNG